LQTGNPLHPLKGGLAEMKAKICKPWVKLNREIWYKSATPMKMIRIDKAGHKKYLKFPLRAK
jgi:hypothetical protein